MNAMKANKWAPLHSVERRKRHRFDQGRRDGDITATSVELTNKGRAFTKRQMPY